MASRRGIALVALVMAGCVSWRATTVEELPATNVLPAEHVLVVTADRAIEIEDTVDDGQTLRGKVVRAWSVAGPFEADYFDDTRDDPDSVADHFGWGALPVTHWAPRPTGAPGTIEIAHADIKRMRVAERHYVKPIFGGVVLVFGTLVLGYLGLCYLVCGLHGVTRG
jgi:hypothetical protein